MIELFSLLNGLHQEETKTIKSSFKKVSTDAESLFLEALYLVMLSAKGKLIPDKELSIRIYGSEKLSAIAKLKSRLFQFVLEVISSDAVLSKEQLFDRADHQVFRIRKKMLQFRVLYRKKLKVDPAVMYHLLSEIIKEAKEYEQYDILVEALYFKKTMVMIRKGAAETGPIEKQIEYYNNSQRALLTANNYYFELVSNQDLGSKAKGEQGKDFLKDTIAELDVYVNETQSASIKYIQKIFQLEDLLKSSRHDISIDICLDILNILNKYKHIYRDERVGFVYDNISLCQVYRNNMADAIASAEKAQEYYSAGSFNFMISREQEFVACFYNHSFARAKTIIAELLELPIINVGEFRHDKYLFFQACALFKSDDPRAALVISNKALEITKDKSRRDLGIRYLRLMCMIELLDYDQAYSAIEALRKTISRNSKQSGFRDEMIYRAFNEFASTGFSTHPTSRLIGIIHELSAKDSVNTWNYYTHELIPVHAWIESKINVRKKEVSYVPR